MEILFFSEVLLPHEEMRPLNYSVLFQINYDFHLFRFYGASLISIPE